MRNELNIIEHIEKYLRGELSVEEKKAFEEKLKTDVNLKKEVELQKEIIKGIERLGVKQSIQKSYKKYKVDKSGFNLGLGTIIIVAVASAFLWYSDSNKAKADELPQFNENGEEVWADADKYLESQKFTINTSKDTVIETDGGIVMYLPAGSFLDENGNEIKEEVEFEVKEALNTAQIIQAGLSSKSGDRLLESAGMFYVNARKDGKTVQINPDKGIYTEVPTGDVNSDMQLFDGKRMTDGSIDWVDPKPLDKFLTPVDINSLNFYPPKYEPKLTALGYDLSDKEFKDSLYYSFAWGENSKSCFKVKSTDKAIMNESFIRRIRDNMDWMFIVNPIECDLFEIKICMAMTSNLNYTPRKISNYVSEEFNPKEKIAKTLLRGGLNKNASIDDEIKSQLEFNFNRDVQILSQKIKVSSEGGCFLSLNLNLEGTEEFLSVELGIWFDKEGESSKCNGPYIPYPSIKTKSNTIKTSSLKFGVKSPYLFAQDEAAANLDEAVATFQVCGINPAKIKAIWSKQFNNSLISTREFEERLKTIFGTCNDAVFDLYINNMNLNLYEIDEMAISMTFGESKAKFLEFASRKDGKVQIDDKRVKKLQRHYERKQKLVAEAVAKTRRKFDKQQRKLDSKIQKERTKHTQSEVKRKSDNYLEEFNLNLKDAYRQLGMKRPKRLDAEGIYKLTLKTGGWKNVDAYVMESLNNRETLDYTDPETGKKAVIKYEPISISVKDEAKYDRVFVYIIPDQLNSFIRMKKEGDKYTEKLNELMNNKLICLAYIGEQAYFYSDDEVTRNEYSIELVKISQADLKDKFNRYDRKQSKNLLREMDYQFIEVKESRRQDILMKRRHLREEIEKVIFPCSMAMPAPESNQIGLSE